MWHVAQVVRTKRPTKVTSVLLQIANCVISPREFDVDHKLSPKLHLFKICANLNLFTTEKYQLDRIQNIYFTDSGNVVYDMQTVA